MKIKCATHTSRRSGPARTILGLTLTATLGATAAQAVPLASLPCHASVSNARPRDYTTVDIRVVTADLARVRTVAHYRTTNTTHTGKASAGGKATISYYISGATPGYKVTVSVYVAQGKRTASCSTSFTPER